MKPLAYKPHIKLRQFRHRPSYWFVVKPTTWNAESGDLVRAAREFVTELNLIKLEQQQ